LGRHGAAGRTVEAGGKALNDAAAAGALLGTAGMDRDTPPPGGPKPADARATPADRSRTRLTPEWLPFAPGTRLTPPDPEMRPPTDADGFPPEVAPVRFLPGRRLLHLLGGPRLRETPGRQDFGATLDSIALSPDGRFALTRAARIRLWDLTSGRVVRSFEAGHEISRVAFLPDGVHARFIGSQLRVVDLRTGRIVAQRELVPRVVRNVALTAGGRHAVVVGGSEAWLVDLGSPEPDRPVATDSAPVTLGTVGLRNAAISPDGRYAAICRPGNRLRVVTVPGGQEVAEFSGFGRVRDFALSATQLIVADDRSLQARPLDIDDATDGPGDEPFDPEPPMSGMGVGMRIAIGDPRDRPIWRHSQRSWINATAVLADTGELLTISRTGEVVIRGLADGRVRRRTQLHHDRLNDVAVRGRRAVVACEDGAIVLLDTATPATVAEPDTHYSTCWRVAFSPDGRFAMTGDGSGRVRLVDLRAGREVLRMHHHSAAVTAAAFSADGRIGATGSRTGRVSVVDLRTGDLAGPVSEAGSPVPRLALSPDGAHLAMIPRDDRLRLIETATGRLLDEFPLGDATIDRPAVVPDPAATDGVAVEFLLDGRLHRRRPGDSAPTPVPGAAPPPDEPPNPGEQMRELFRRRLDDSPVQVRTSPDGRYLLAFLVRNGLLIYERDDDDGAGA
jgi:WD40 repeat protein